MDKKIEIKQIALEIFGGCNYKCPMCPQADGRESDFVRKLPFDTYKKIIDESKQYGVKVVSLQGSGEPTLRPDMPKFVEYAKKAGLKCISLTNGYHLTESLSRDLISAGLDTLRVSAVGYDKETYHKWMSKDAFHKVRDQVVRFKELNEQAKGATELTLYHLIIDEKNTEYEVNMYRKNWIDYSGCPGEIWLMHNWGGQYEEMPYQRAAPKKRTCGRPASPYLTVRAGGLNGQSASVVPCCFVLGQDSKAVLGHLDTQTIAEVLEGEKYQELRDKHAKSDFDSIDYCRDCDQLYDIPEALVWTNVPGKEYGQSKYIQDLDYRQWNL
ncbi:radical SAM protein [Burkholderiales bacterium]|jgi:organic radical activating enzyme|nr:radical SAM protein [Burkholderiales bacterium]